MSQVKNKFILSVDESTVKLNNDSFLLARNFADTLDISMFKVNASDNIEAGASLDMGAFNLVTSALIDGIDIAAKAADTDLNTTHRSSDGSDHSIVTANQTAVGNIQTEVDNIEAAMGAMVDAAGDYVAHAGKNYINANADATADLIDLDAQIKVNADAITGLSAATSFKGSLDASLLGAQLDDSVNGYYYIVTVAGTLFGGLNPITLAVGDHLVTIDDTYAGTPTDGNDFSKIDNTESSDIVRSGDFASAEIYVGTSGPTVLTGDVTVSDAGVSAIGAAKVTNAMLAGSITDANLSSDYVQTSEVDGTTVKFTGGNLQSLTPFDKFVTLVAGDITNQYIDLAHVVAPTDKSIMVFTSGLHQTNGTDYGVALTGGAGGVTRISFLGDLAALLIATDTVIIKYSYFA